MRLVGLVATGCISNGALAADNEIILPASASSDAGYS